MKRYNPKEIEPKWQKYWDDNQTYKADLTSDKPKYMAMSMFNYPSGAGIHIGHAMNYTISDVLARFKRQQGYESYHPVGWDAFGLPAENYAIKSGVSPQKSMANIIPMYHKQYKAMGWSNDWSKEISTHEPEYYKWTQWIFSQMYQHGLAYQDSRMQWWCAIDNTVLANEQVIDGKCWRHDGPDDPLVEKKEVKQWFFKITDYADEILEATEDLDWTESVKLAQKNWIGKSKGAEISFKLDSSTNSVERPNFLILHGFKGYADKNFIPALKKDLEAQGYKVQAPQLPNTDVPSDTEQVSYVLDNCTIDENTIIVGHSLGGGVAMKVLEKIDHPIRELLLVAPVIEPEFRTGISVPQAFWKTFKFGYDYELITKQAKKRTILSDTLEAARRKPYLEYLSGKIDAQLLETTANQKHFLDENESFIAAQAMPSINVFTTRPDTLYGVTFLVVAPEHENLMQLVSEEQKEAVLTYRRETAIKTEVERQASKEKTGVFTGTYAVNPVNDEKIPIWVADYVLAGYGTGAVMAVPAHDERDNEFAKKFDLPIVRVVKNDAADDECSHDEGALMNSGSYDGMSTSDAREKIVADLEKTGAATEKTTYKLRDWSVSRQRYWGAPIPIIHCPKDGIVPVPDDQLPVVLPEMTDFAPSGDGRGALARATDWLHVDCPKCGDPAERETDTLDTYICSSWYMLRYLDPRNEKQAFDSVIANKWMPVDFYNGADHATAHMMYARFITRFFSKLGLLENPEPFKRFLFNGKVTASDGTMFSKSKGNGVDPLEIIDSGYGADALRTYLMFAAPLELWVHWDSQGVPGCYRFLNRVWNITQEFLEAQSDDGSSEKALRIIHPTIKKVTADLEDQKYNTAIAALMKCCNELYELKAKDGFAGGKDWRFALESLTMLVGPFAPHTAEELWHDLGHEDTLQKDHWPAWDEQYLVSDTLTIAIQVNGKLRGEIEIAAGAPEAEVIAAAQANEKVKTHTDGKEIIKTIYVPGKIVNLVVK